MQAFQTVSRFLVALSLLIATTHAHADRARPSRPSAHIIAGVPWHEQDNGLFCGAGSLASVFDYWGPEIEQRMIVNVARTSSNGTWFQDIVRSGHFSALSAAQGSYYPQDVPQAGFPERTLGYAAFGHWAPSSWLEQVKDLVAQDIPVVVLVNFAPEGGGGHYRVVIGYDDPQGLVYLIDPWGREQNHDTDWTGVIAWSAADFEQSWNYISEGTNQPYRGAIIVPWTVALSAPGHIATGSTISITADIGYPCPAPFDCTRHPASNASAHIALPQGMSLVGDPATISLGNLAAGQSRRVTWRVRADQPAAGKTISITASGQISGSVGPAYWAGGNVSYPAYEYTDRIGGTATLSF